MKGISEKTLIKIKDLKASVKLNNGDMLTTVTNANMELQRGRSYAIVGKSGSGKTSLISIIGLLNREYEGEYLYDGFVAVCFRIRADQYRTIFIGTAHT